MTKATVCAILKKWSSVLSRQLKQQFNLNY